MASAVQGIFALALAIWFAYEGFQRRRNHWASAEWSAFAKGIALALTALIVGMTMAFAVDLGIYKAVSASRAFRAIWAGLLTVLNLSGGLGVMWQLWWFANEDPAKPPRFFMKSTQAS